MKKGERSEPPLSLFVFRPGGAYRGQSHPKTAAEQSA